VSDIWYLLRDYERYVYHYTRGATLATHILPTGRLRFSRFEGVNDPRESKEWALSFISGTHLDPDYAALELRLNEALKHTWRIGCFVQDSPDAVMTGRDERGSETLRRAYKRGHSRPRMWAQYAERYSGACLVFDRAKLDASVRSVPTERVYCGAVKYLDPSPVPRLGKSEALTFSLLNADDADLDAAANRHIEQHKDDLFFRKVEDWQHECELRWAAQSRDAGDFYVPVDGSLVGIALGEDFAPGAKTAVAAFGEANPTVSIAFMGWQNGFPQPKPTHWRILAAS